MQVLNLISLNVKFSSIPIDMCTLADIWSLGVLYYELLYGELPWNPNSTTELITEISK